MISPQQQLAHYQRHPPRCLAGFLVSPAEMCGVSFDGHASGPVESSETIIEGGGTINSVFLLRCSCGHDRHRVFGYYWRNPDYRNELVFLSPITAECENCGKLTEVIDTDFHGYDAELEEGIVATARARGNIGEYACDKCGLGALQICARFEYPDDILGANIREFCDREHDFFSWFTLLGKCNGCSRVMTVAEFECA